MGIMKYVNRAGLELELGRMCKSVKGKHLKEAIEALRPFISKKALKRQEEQYERIKYSLFAQETCGECGTRHSVNTNCWNCRTNCPG